MLKAPFFTILLYFSLTINAQVSSSYTVSFENAMHHEATIDATFTNLKSSEVEFTMSRSSPGRYALHEFVKNVYNVKVTDGSGNELKPRRTNPYSWFVNNNDGTIKVSYTLYANHGDGTYAQIDESHAHLNAPATYIYVPETQNDAYQITYNVREDLNWKVATQLKSLNANTYYAKDLQYLMDSPVEISNYKKRTFTIESQTISFVLHDDKASENNFDDYFEDVKKIVLQQKAVFGELPKYDYKNYTFLACYMPNVTGDAMEHRNSTFLTTTRSLANGGKEQNISSVAHEFFHCWNVERIRPKSLEPFDFLNANMSGELWFAEGFTNYYDELTMCRAGVNTKEKYLSNLNETFNKVWTVTGRNYFNPIEMSYQASFVDAAKSVDEQNKENTYISYYTYGEMLGLALDLSLREKQLNLDDFMKLMWNKYGKTNTFYTINDIHTTLSDYVGTDFGDKFFNNFIYESKMPDYETFFKNVGIDMQTKNQLSFGATVRFQKLISNPKQGTTAYDAGFQKEDTILKVGDFTLSSLVDFDLALSKYKIGDEILILYVRYGKVQEKKVTLKQDIRYQLSYIPIENLSSIIKENKNQWLNPK